MIIFLNDNAFSTNAIRFIQNGRDRSGMLRNLEWLSTTQSSATVTKYRHWEILSGNWIGEYNMVNNSYSNINQTNINHSLFAIRNLTTIYKDDPVVVGVEPSELCS
jgi:hypothetical protein